MKNRQGIIKINMVFIEQEPLFLLSLFANFIPLDINTNNHLRIKTYIGISPLFDEISETEIVPIYDVVFNNIDGKEYFDHFERLNKSS